MEDHSINIEFVLGYLNALQDVINGAESAYECFLDTPGVRELFEEYLDYLEGDKVNGS